MTLIEGIGDEVVQFFIGLIFILIVVLAWYTTNTTNDGTFRTVFLLERRRLRAVRRLITHTESSTIAEGTNQENLETNQTNPTMEENKPTSSDADQDEVTNEIPEESRIVEAMDAPNTEGLRRRINSEDINNSSENNGDVSVNGSNKNEGDNEAGSSKQKENNKISIKLMFINDALRHVKASLNENVGDFKRQHFQVELEARKVVKLIFNGQILERDSDTLQSCGLFDNCVVHCLVLSDTRPTRRTGSQVNNSSSAPSNGDSGTNNQNQPHEWHLENYLLTILLFFLAAAWYFRYVYSQLYTVTATIGLILMTGIFTIIMFGMHFPENVDLNHQNTENVGT